MMIEKTEKFDEAVKSLSPNLINKLLALPTNFKLHVQELRLRVNRPLAVVCDDDIYYLTNSNTLTKQINQNLFITDKKDVEDSFKKICGFSVHSYQHEIINGFITISGGHRVGLVGTATTENKKVVAVRNISSINLRIAREINGVADELINKAFTDLNFSSLLLAGPPSSGKTTVLRDLATNLANSKLGSNKVVVIDERSEIGAVFNAQPQNNIGINCDILDGYPKSEGIMLAIRTMSPDIIVCDEIGGRDDILALMEGANAGVKFLATVHAGSRQDLFSRKTIKDILEIDVFEKIALMKNRNPPGEIQEIFSKEELRSEIDRHNSFNSYRLCSGKKQFNEVFSKNFNARKNIVNA